MKTLQSRQVEKGLKMFGFMRKPGKGRGDGHEDWIHANGTKVSPPLRKKELHIRSLYCLTDVLESAGICCRQEFYQACARA